MYSRSKTQSGEIMTILTVASLVVVAVGALLGNSLTRNQQLGSEAAGGRCAAGELKGPDVGKDCSGEATGRAVNCGMRVIADTFKVEDFVDNGKTFTRISGNFCYTGNLTTGANKGKLYITTNHPGKPACYKVLAIDTHASFFPGSMPVCDQTGRWATTNPQLPIPARFRGPDKTNFFSMTVEKPVNGCMYLNTTTEGQQGGGGAGTNFDIWKDARLCGGGATATPTPTTGGQKACNDICTGADQCGTNICVQTSDGTLRCRNPRDVTDASCREATPTPTCGGRTCPTNTPTPTCGNGTCPTVTPSPTEGVRACNAICTGVGQCGNNICVQTSDGTLRCRNPLAIGDPTCRENRPTATPTPTEPGATNTPTPTKANLTCNDVCSPTSSCPSDLICIETGTSMRCRRLPNYEDASCGQPTNTPTPSPTGVNPTNTPTPTGPVGACTFNPISFVKVRKADGTLQAISSPDPLVWGTLNNKVIDIHGSNNPTFYSKFDGLGEYYPCKSLPGGVCTITTPTCCGPVGHQYNIQAGDSANVLLKYDTARYRVVQHCFNGDDSAHCKDVNNDPLYKNITVACGQSYRYGWILEEIKGGSCPFLGNGCKVGDVQADVKNGSSNRATISWDYPSNCPELREGIDQLWIDIVDENEKIVCAKSVLADRSDRSTECKLGRDVERSITSNITKWDPDMTYHANVWTVRADDNSCLIGERSNDFGKPGDDGDGGGEARSHQLDVFQVGGQGDECYIAADTGNGTNAKNDERCHTSRRPTANGLDELKAKYANRTGGTIRMLWQINSCNGKLLSDLGGVCEDFVATNGVNSAIDLPAGKMLTCTWLDPKDKPFLTPRDCEIGDINFDKDDGGGDNGGGTGGKGVCKQWCTNRTQCEAQGWEFRTPPDGESCSVGGDAWCCEPGTTMPGGTDPNPTPGPRGDAQIAGTWNLKNEQNPGWISNINTTTIDELRPIICNENATSAEYQRMIGVFSSSSTENCVRLDDIIPNGQDVEPEGKDGLVHSFHRNFSQFPINGNDGIMENIVNGGTYKVGCRWRDDWWTLGGLAGHHSCRLTTVKGGSNVDFNIVLKSDRNVDDGPVTNKIFVNFEINNNVNNHPNYYIKNLKPIVCKLGSTIADYPGVGAFNTEKCIVFLDLVGKEWVESQTVPYELYKERSGERLQPGQKVVVGCRYESEQPGFNKYGVCPAVEATVGDTIRMGIMNPIRSSSASITGDSCDVNDDGACNTVDYIQLTQRIGTDETDLRFDLNGDNRIDIEDVSVVLANFGSTQTPQ